MSRMYIHCLVLKCLKFSIIFYYKVRIQEINNNDSSVIVVIRCRNMESNVERGGGHECI